MPYKQKEELPKRVKNNLPAHAQKIFKEAYNSAWEQYEDEDARQGDDSREEVANKVAWSAVKKKYKKEGDDWVEK